MSHDTWTDLGPEDDFSQEAHRCVTVEDVPLVVMHVDGAFYALENRCPHASRPLGDGERAGLTLTCPYHGYTYHIKTGKNIDCPDEEPPAKTFPLRVQAGIVQVLLDPKET